MDWITGARWRLPMLLGIYFAAHVLIRSSVSSSLDFDESEQVFLSQHLLMGYNSQPPLYTWLQRGLFETFGYSVFSLALLKNLFIWLTYVLVFESVRKATDNLRLAGVATLGMFSIPQIAWESHRDLSHTVAAMCATALLMYAVISLSKESRRAAAYGWYVLIGIAVGLGALFKYNFAIVAVALVVAAASVPRYRRLLVDRRILISIAIAAAMVLPHAWWMLQHPGLASEKTITTLTSGQTDFWMGNVLQGLLTITISLVTCCAGPAVVFWMAFVPRGTSFRMLRSQGWEPTGQLLERFLLTVVVILLAIVLSGHAVEFENRWFQPFVFLVPAWLTLVFAPSVLARHRVVDVSARASLAVMGVILIAVLVRPMVARFRGEYLRLNAPYANATQRMLEKLGSSPDLIVGYNMRVAGNLKMQNPDALVISCDAPHLADAVANQHPESFKHVLIVCDKYSAERYQRLTSFTEAVLQAHLVDHGRPLTVDVEYLYGAEGDRKRFVFADYEEAPVTQPRQRVANARRGGSANQ